MKKVVLLFFLLLASGFAANAQSINDAPRYTFITVQMVANGGTGTIGDYGQYGRGGHGGAYVTGVINTGGSLDYNTAQHAVITVDDEPVLIAYNGDSYDSLQWRWRCTDFSTNCTGAPGGYTFNSNPGQPGFILTPNSHPFPGRGGYGVQAQPGYLSYPIYGIRGSLRYTLVEDHVGAANPGVIRFYKPGQCIFGGVIYGTGCTAKNNIDYQWQSSSTSDFSADVIDIPNQRNPYKARIPLNHNPQHFYFRLRAICGGIQTTSNTLHFSHNSTPLTAVKHTPDCRVELKVPSLYGGNRYWQSASDPAMTTDITTLSSDSTITVQPTTNPIYYKYIATCGSVQVVSNTLTTQQYMAPPEAEHAHIQVNLLENASAYPCIGRTSHIYSSFQGTAQQWESSTVADFSTNVSILGTSSTIDIVPTPTPTYYRQKMYCAERIMYSGVVMVSNEAFAKRIYVNMANTTSGDGSSWATAINNIENAFLLAPLEGGGEIWVAQGTYKPLIKKGFTIDRKMKIYGGFAGTESSLNDRNTVLNTTIFSGDIGTVGDDSDNAYHLLSFKSSKYNCSTATYFPIDSTMLIDGITFTKGRSVVVNGASSSVINSGNGGVCETAEGISPVFKNCIFTDNYAERNGGVIHFAFANNEASTPRFINSVFIGNTAKKGGVMSVKSEYVHQLQTDVPLEPRLATPAANNTTAPNNVVNTQKLDNTTDLTRLKGFVNCVFTNNQAIEKGGVLYTEGKRHEEVLLIPSASYPYTADIPITIFKYIVPTFTNATFYNNTAANNGGEIAYTESECVSISRSCSGSTNNPLMFGTFNNCIIWKGEGQNGLNLFGYNQTAANVFNNCSIQGNANNGANPLFQDVTDLDGSDNKWFTEDDGLMPSCLSPVLNAGSNTNAPTTDALGNTIYGSIIDRGAYERQSVSCIGGIYEAPAGTPPNTCQTVTVTNVSGNKWYDFIYDNKIILSINPQGQNLGDVTVDVGNQGASNAVGSTVYLGRGIDIISTAPPTANYKLRLFYLDAEMQAYAQSINDNTVAPSSFNVAWRSGGGSGCNIANYSGGQSGLVPNTSLAEGEFGLSDNGFYLQMTLNHFTVFAATTSTSPFPLPVKLLSFSGYAKNKTNVLEWRTATEQNNKGFEIERSLDGQNWKTIGFVNGAGNSTTTQNYTFTDNLSALGAVRGDYYYRFRQIDFDGQFEYSSVISIKRDSKAVGIKCYPNPARNILNIDATDRTQPVTVTDEIGRTVQTHSTTPNTIDLSELVKGIYFVNIGEEHFKIVKL